MAFEPTTPPRRQPPRRPRSTGGEQRTGLPARTSGRRPAPDARRRSSASGRQSGRKTEGSGYQPRYASRTRRRKNPRQPLLLAVLALVVLGILSLPFLLKGGDKEAAAPQVPETAPAPTRPELPHEVSSAKLTVTGDLLPHKIIYAKGSVVYQDEQDYDFDPVFKYLHGYTDQADYAVANLETSLFGPEKPYAGNPRLNTPDQIVDGAKNAGFDMLLTANNHCNDTDLPGVLRTVKVVREKGLTALGTNLTDEEPKYHIEDINGIKIGMLCYTYEDSQDPKVVTFNYHPLPKESSGLVCSFPKFTEAKSREPFYQGLEAQITEMREKGAEAIVLFLHWGEEYHLEPSQDQREMAQRLCNLGVDLVIGGHPHVVQPVELITSTRDPEHKMVCLYSLGNAVSNQRREAMKSQKSGHTEDGMLFNATFRKYSDGSVHLAQVDVIPTGVYKHGEEKKNLEYNILPLEDSTRDQWQQRYALDLDGLQKTAESYNRTMSLVGPGLTRSNQWLMTKLPDYYVPETEPAGELTQPKGE